MVMRKRLLSLKELRLVITKNDVFKGQLKDGYLAHIARVNPMGDLIAVACDNMHLESIRWMYFFNPFQVFHLTICKSCMEKTWLELTTKTWDDWVWENSPASNTGVN